MALGGIALAMKLAEVCKQRHSTASSVKDGGVPIIVLSYIGSNKPEQVS